MKRLLQKLYNYMCYLGAPKNFYLFSSRLLPIFILITFVLLTYGMIGALFLSPPDYQQGDAFRIIYIHVPSAFLSLAAYVLMAINALIVLVWRIKVADVLLKATAPVGAWFTFLALITGAIWGKPMWGTWWIWDARLTSELILFFLYLGAIALRQAIPIKEKQQRIVALFVLVGVIDLPIIHYSVYWWNTLHQGATITRLHPTIHSSMLYPLLAMIFGFLTYLMVSVLLRARTILLQEGQQKHWVNEL